MTCKYEISWVGPCGKPANEDGWCGRHAEVMCSCGKKATGECGETAFGGSLVCGFPTCNGYSCHQHRYGG